MTAWCHVIFQKFRCSRNTWLLYWMICELTDQMIRWWNKIKHQLCSQQNFLLRHATGYNRLAEARDGGWDHTQSNPLCHQFMLINIHSRPQSRAADILKPVAASELLTLIRRVSKNNMKWERVWLMCMKDNNIPQHTENLVFSAGFNKPSHYFSPSSMDQQMRRIKTKCK